MVFSALDELEYGSLKSFFKKNFLRVGTVSTISIYVTIFRIPAPNDKEKNDYRRELYHGERLLIIRICTSRFYQFIKLFVITLPSINFASYIYSRNTTKNEVFTLKKGLD